MLRVYFDQAFLKHQPGGWHPESPARLEAVIDAVKSFPDIELIETCRQAEPAEIGLIHSLSYIDYITSIPREHVMLDPDTEFSPGTLEASLKAAGAAIDGVEFALQGKNRRVFCAVRPPGHHAETSRAMGFCIFNNIAIAAAHAIKKKLASRIVIVDWDVHHGNGTQQAFYNSPEVFYISTHQYPYYPGTGAATETGAGRGDGFNLNIPMAHGSGDADYRKAFIEKVVPAVESYAPELILVSAGFDGHRDDPLAGMNLSSEMYGEITKMLIDLAGKHCYGRIVSLLEGGYHLPSLKESVCFFLKEMLRE